MTQVKDWVLHITETLKQDHTAYTWTVMSEKKIHFYPV